MADTLALEAVSLQALHDLLAAAPVVLFTAERGSDTVSAAGGALAGIGTTRPGRFTLTEVAATPGGRELVAGLERAFAGETFSLHTTASGYPLATYFQPLVDATGQVASVIGLVINLLSDLRGGQAERGLFDFRVAGRFQLDAHGRPLTANLPMAQMLGYDTPAQLVADQRDFREVLFVDPARYRALVDVLRQHGRVRGFRFEAARRDGQRRWLELSMYLEQDGANKITGYEGWVEDCTARRELEDEQELVLEQFRLLVEGVHDYALFRLDAAGNVASWNVGAERLKGYRPDEIIGQSLTTFYTAADRERGLPAQLLAQARATGRAETEGWQVRKNGERFWADVVINALYDTDGALTGFAKITRDQTERREAAARLAASEEQFRGAFDNAAIGMALVSLQGHWLQVNAALCKLLGYPEDELLLRTFQQLTYGEDLHADLQLLNELLRGEITSYTMEKRYIRRDGRLIWAQLDVSLVRDEQGAPLHFLSQIQDIDRRKQVEAQLQHQALHDALTGLPNRTLFLDRLESALRRRRESEETLAVLFLDLDGFKEINDNMGHASGDQVLVQIARRLRRSLRGGDTVCRLGGDEFTILLEGGITQAHVERLARRLIKKIEEPMVMGDMTARISTSIGIALVPECEDSADAVLIAADHAMYEAKQDGKGRWALGRPQHAPRLTDD